MNIDLNIAAALPEMILATMACLILLIDAFYGNRYRQLTCWTSIATLLLVALLAASDISTQSDVAFGGMYFDDPLGNLLKAAIFLSTAVVFLYSREYLEQRDIQSGEFYVLGLFGALGMSIMASAGNFLTIYLGLELLALSLYALVAFNRKSDRSTEAAMKYFVLGAIASGILLYGLSILYGLTGTLDITGVSTALANSEVNNQAITLALVFIVVSLAFKLGAVPFHMWLPDVYQGSPTATTLYLGSAPKLAAFAMIMRLLVGGLENFHSSWQEMLVILAILSMGAGNLIAIAQTNIKRMLAYSTISHMGFFLLGILSATETGYSASLFYVMVYSVMALGTFGMILLFSRRGFEAEELSDFKGLSQHHPWYAFLMLLLMFSMAGVPPTVGFYAKLSVIRSVLQVELVWVAVVAVLFAVVGAFYYLRVIKLVYFDHAEGEALIVESPVANKVMLSINVLALIVVLPWMGEIISFCTEVITSLAG
ncbi:MAG: NADH-quinone oxidoreductase subunit NuoN [Arenicellales bacterium]|jgi:NADH-quinone oxidoreductase subunit N|nr:NADH-quinone oxidoreductase subunit NuoN [Arenicellales bacterium]MDP7155857.1 NADH-quinone oxidoreductase subunit NuoN [Arenicellales bacterium]MDP7283584.1 NADH-quinone oxidoreductase subunit NuoN [Arenicellales bacterium]MDP7481633.1 NADH-quinone oxidoreductase subunit NuoN [Arenicellales bacterium]